jgi:hypothetical protein
MCRSTGIGGRDPTPPPPRTPACLSREIKPQLWEDSSYFGLQTFRSGSRTSTAVENATHQTTQDSWMSLIFKETNVDQPDQDDLL